MNNSSEPSHVYQDIAVQIEKLIYAKDAVIWLVGHESSNVDFHGLSYWTAEVERLRSELKALGARG